MPEQYLIVWNQLSGQILNSLWNAYVRPFQLKISKCYCSNLSGNIMKAKSQNLLKSSHQLKRLKVENLDKNQHLQLKAKRRKRKDRLLNNRNPSSLLPPKQKSQKKFKKLKKMAANTNQLRRKLKMNQSLKFLPKMNKIILPSSLKRSIIFSQR